MLTAILGGLKALTGLSDAIGNVSKAIADARIAAINAKTNEERIAADERVKTLEARRDVMVEEAKAGQRGNGTVRAMLALPIAILLWKVFVWDKAFGQWTGGHTDALDANLWNVVMIVLGFYFLYEAVRAVRR